MPLIIICGNPSVGKTTYTNQISQYLQEKGKKCIILNEETLSIQKTIYKEKNYRCALKSNTQKYLTTTDVVIVDSMNYIKGFRYELYCLARAINTTCMIAHIVGGIEKAEKYSKLNTATNKFPEELLQEYISRMEEPSYKNKWDQPLLKITDKIPFELVEKHIFNAKPLSEPACVKKDVVVLADDYYQSDQICQQIISNISSSSVGDTISYTAATKKIKLTRIISPVEAKSIRSDYSKLCKTHPPPLSAVADSFLEYIEMRLKN